MSVFWPRVRRSGLAVITNMDTGLHGVMVRLLSGFGDGWVKFKWFRSSLTLTPGPKITDNKPYHESLQRVIPPLH
jgi:hypothetical protein